MVFISSNSLVQELFAEYLNSGGKETIEKEISAHTIFMASKRIMKSIEYKVQNNIT